MIVMNLSKYLSFAEFVNQGDYIRTLYEHMSYTLYTYDNSL